MTLWSCSTPKRIPQPRAITAGAAAVSQAGGAPHVALAPQPHHPAQRRRLAVSGTLKGHRRRQVLAHHRASGAPCHLCGLPIDLSLDTQRHPLASCVDELVPRKHGGDPLDINNTAHTHRLCNGKRGTKPITEELRNACRTAVLAHRDTADLLPW